jgi:hypothetical protein
MHPRVKLKMMLVILLAGRWADKFLRTNIFIDFASKNKHTLTMISSIILCKLNEIKTRPRSSPIKMKKKMLSMRPRLKVRIDNGRKKNMVIPKPEPSPPDRM